MKTYSLLCILVFSTVTVFSATIDRMTLQPSVNAGYSPTSFSFPQLAQTYYLSDGTSWGSGAGVGYVTSINYQSSYTSGGNVYYDFSAPLSGDLFQNTDYDNGSHSAQGTLGYAQDMVLVAQIGSTHAQFSGGAVILDNTETWYGQPRFNYYSASVGQSVYFEFDYTILNGTWQVDTFEKPFTFSDSGYIDFTRVVPEPSSGMILSFAGTSVWACMFYLRWSRGRLRLR
jgi:hypothetical protein